jgi:hypothetical protein
LFRWLASANNADFVRISLQSPIPTLYDPRHGVLIDRPVS